MNRQSLPISEILVLDRQRLDLGDLRELADSILQFGLIQPIVVNQEKRLIAGGRRLEATRLLGHDKIDVVFKETLSVDELHELELEENVRRKEMSWQERCLNIQKIHSLKVKRGALEGNRWGVRETGEMLGMGKTSVGYNNEIAGKLTYELALPVDQRRYWQCDSFTAAWQLRMRDEEELIQAELIKETALASQAIVLPAYTPPPSLEQGVEPLGDLYTSEAQPWRPLPAPLDDTVAISSRLYNVDCIDFMSSPDWHEVFGAILTDPPYGIEMSNLDQANSGMVDIDTVSAEHTVVGNEDLFTKFFPAAYNCLKPNAFLVLWCDIMQWQRLYDLATAAGFKVQRWPITWIKTHRCMNQSANQNFTKTTEIAMVCRKGTATMVELAGECHILAPHDEYKEQLGHPFVKPFAVWEYLINHVTFEGQYVLDPFAGRGSCPISIIRKKRHFFACEKDTAHFNALVENIKQHYLRVNPKYKFI